ncbi:MAG: hypothetical protein Q4D26_10480 [Clostridia bacterium]|nr:hypothetical protein [Clostridia bacterium]
MRVCPTCGRIYNDAPAISRKDNKTEICPDCGTREAISSIPHKKMTPADRTKAKVYSTGNKWAIENFNKTHGLF